nr:uncharacterized protein LOC120285648 [Drosophila simulans]
MRLKDVVLSPYRSLLRGLGKAGTVPLGVFAGAVQIDDMETVQNFIVVADEKMEDDALLRYDFLSRFQFKLDANGFTFSSFSACPEVADINQIICTDDTEADRRISYLDAGRVTCSAKSGAR